MAPGIGVSARGCGTHLSSEHLTNSAEPLSKPTRTIRGLRPDPGWWLPKPYGIGSHLASPTVKGSPSMTTSPGRLGHPPPRGWPRQPAHRVVTALSPVSITRSARIHPAGRTGTRRWSEPLPPDCRPAPFGAGSTASEILAGRPITAVNYNCAGYDEVAGVVAAPGRRLWVWSVGGGYSADWQTADSSGNGVIGIADGNAPPAIRRVAWQLAANQGGIDGQDVTKMSWY
jgi:hypothetical protein